MHGLAVQGAGAHGPKPAGMLRIRQGSQERYIWPVHLPGWLAEGWRVAGAEPPAMATPTADQPEAGVVGAARTRPPPLHR
jgi:hypothetical protein